MTTYFMRFGTEALDQKRRFLRCERCSRGVWLTGSRTFCNRCEYELGVSTKPYKRRRICKGCGYREMIYINKTYCKKCSALKAKEVLGTGPKLLDPSTLEERLSDIPARLLPQPVLAPPVPYIRPTHMRALDWVDDHMHYFFFGFWGLLTLVFVIL